MVGEAVRSSIIPGIVEPKKASASSGSNTSSKRWCRPSKLQSYLSLYLVLYDMIACSSSLLEVIGAEVRALTTSCHLGGENQFRCEPGDESSHLLANTFLPSCSCG